MLLFIRGVTLLMLLAIAYAANAASPNYRALLVGVSEYPNLKKELQLAGAGNDVIRMREALIKRGVSAQNITMLADGVVGAGLPTRQRIMEALEKLASTAKPNDYIILHLAGHGSQQPAPSGSPFASQEQDGLLETFLPRDVESWRNLPNGQGGEVKNAIIKTEIRTAVDRMTAAGAFVWGIFDSCHSATLVRSAGNGSPDIRLRQLRPADLGIPDTAIENAKKNAKPNTNSPARSASKTAVGQSVFFYAAQTTEATAEMNLPFELSPGHPDRKPHGLFTFTIVQALESGAGMTYQQLAQHVLTRYGGIGEARATPLFTGTALQSGVLGKITSSVEQWLLLDGKDLAVGAGLLAEVQTGSVLAILPSATAATIEAIGYAKVSSASLATATMTPVAFRDKPALSLAELKQGKVARMIQRAVQFEFVVDADLSLCARPCAFESPLAKMKEASAIPGVQLRWAALGQTANIKLVANGNRLWLMPPSLASTTACTIGNAQARQNCERQLESSLVYIEAAAGATTDGLLAQIQPALHAASRASNLMRLAGVLGGASVARQVGLQVQHVPANGKPTALSAIGAPRIKPGDKVRIALENNARTAMDVTVLYVDSKFGVQVMFPLGLGASNRLGVGDKPEPFDININDSTLGIERLTVIAVEAKPKAEKADFSFLAQATLASAVVTRGRDTAEAASEQLFRDAGFAEHTTRGGAPSVPSNVGMQVFTWRVTP